MNQENRSDTPIAPDKASLSHPNDAQDIRSLADAHADAGRWEDALDAYKQALALEPTNADLHNDLGLAYEQVGKLDEAESAYQQAIALDPQDSVTYYNLGTMYEEQHRVQEAIQVYEKCILYSTDTDEYSDVEKRLARLSSGTPTGQSRLAYRVTAIILLLNIFIGTISAAIGNPAFVRPTAAAVSCGIDLALAIGLFRLRRWARNLALVRVTLGAILLPVLLFALFKYVGRDYLAVIVGIDIPTVTAMTITLWSYCGAVVLLLTGLTKPRRMILAVAIYIIITVGIFGLSLTLQVAGFTWGDITSLFGPKVVITLSPNDSASVTPESLNQARTVVENRLSYILKRRVNVAVDGDYLQVKLTAFDDLESIAQLATKVGTFGFFDSSDCITPGTPAPDDVTYIITKNDVSLAVSEPLARSDEWYVIIHLTPEGTRKFADYTKANQGRYLVIARDGIVVASPQVQEPILDGNATIRGNLDKAFATSLAAELNSGRLPFPLVVVE